MNLIFIVFNYILEIVELIVIAAMIVVSWFLDKIFSRQDDCNEYDYHIKQSKKFKK